MKKEEYGFSDFGKLLFVLSIFLQLTGCQGSNGLVTDGLFLVELPIQFNQFNPIYTAE